MGVIDTIGGLFGLARYAPPAPTALALDVPARARRAQYPTAEQRVDSFLNDYTGIGGSTDRGATARPDTSREPLSEDELRALHRFNGYARKIVDLYPSEATRKGWTVNDGSDDTNPFRDDDRRLDVPGKFAEADRTAREFGGAVILMVTDDVKIGGFRSLETPLRPGAQVNALQVFEPIEARAVEWDGDPWSTTYREPKIWHITPLTPAFGAMTGVRVHASRCVYVDGAAVDRVTRMHNQGFGDSVLEACFDAIRNKTTHDQGGAILSSELHVNVLKLSNLAQISVSDQAAYVWSRIKALAQGISLLNMVMIGKDEDYSTRAANVTGYADLDDAAKTVLAAVADMPKTRLFNEEPGGLGSNGNTGLDQWDKAVAAHQELALRKPLTRLYTVLYAAKGTTPGTWSIEFTPLDEPSAAEIADIELKNAQSDDLRISGQVLAPEHVAKSRFGPKGYGHGILPVDDPAEATDAANERAAADAEAAAAQVGAAAEPAPSVAPVDPNVAAVADTALNGAQVESLLSVLDALASGTYTADGAIAIIRAAFPSVPEPTVRQIVANVVPKPAAAEPAPNVAPVEPNAAP